MLPYVRGKRISTCSRLTVDIEHSPGPVKQLVKVDSLSIFYLLAEFAGLAEHIMHRCN
jgi:hypothetical protein